MAEQSSRQGGRTLPVPPGAPGGAQRQPSENHGRRDGATGDRSPMEQKELDDHQDDPFKLVIKLKHDPYYVDRVMGITDWLYIRASEDKMEKLQKQLKDCGVTITDNRKFSEVEVTYTGTYNFHTNSAIEKKIEYICVCFSHAANTLWRNTFPVRDVSKDNLKRELEGNQVLKTLSAWHMPHEDLVLVCDETNKDVVSKEVTDILINMKTVPSAESASFTECFLDEIVLDEMEQRFLTENQKAQEYLASEFRKAGAESKFQLDKGKIVLTGLDKVNENWKAFFSKLIGLLVIDFSSKRVKSLLSMDEICKLIDHKMQAQTGKFLALPATVKHIHILALSDVFETCLEVIKQIEYDVVEERYPVEKFVFEKLTENNCAEIMHLGTNLPEVKVIIRQTTNTAFLGFHLIGTKKGVVEAKQKIKEYTACRKQFNFSVEPRLKALLLQTSQAAVEYVSKTCKENGFWFEFDRLSASCQFTINPNQENEAVSLFSKLIVCQLYDMNKSKFVVAGNITVPQISAEITSCLKELHEPKLLFEISGSILRLTGTLDIFLAAENCVKKILNDVDAPEVDVNESLAVQLSEDKSEEKHQTRASLSTIPSTECQTRNSFGVSEKVDIDEMTLKLLTDIPQAFKYAETQLQAEGCRLEMEAGQNNVTLTAQKSEDIKRGKEMLQKCVKKKQFGDHKYLVTPTEIRAKLYKRHPDLAKTVMIEADSGGILVMFGTSNVFDQAQKDISAFLEDFSEGRRTLSLSEAEEDYLQRNIHALVSKNENVDIQIENGKVIIRGAKHCLDSYISDVQGILGQLNEIDRQKPETVYLKERVSPLVFTLLQKNKCVRRYIADELGKFGCVLELKHDNILVFSALTNQALEKAKKIVSEEIQEKKHDLKDKPFWLMLGIEGIKREIQSKGRQHEGKFVIDGDEDTCSLMIACTKDIQNGVEDCLRNLERAYRSDTCKCPTKPPDRTFVSALEEELYRSEQFSNDTVKLFPKDGTILLVGKSDIVDKAKKRTEMILKTRENERKIQQGIQQREVKLSDGQLCLTEISDVHDYIITRLKNVNLLMTLNLETKSILVSGLTEEAAAAGVKIVKSCFKEKCLDLKDDSMLKNMTVNDFKEMIDAQPQIHKGKYVFLEGETFTLVSTDDVFTDILKMIESKCKICLDTDEHVVCSVEQMEYLKRFRKSFLSDIEKRGVELHHIKSEGQYILKLSGNDDSIVHEVQASLQEMCSMITVKSFPFNDETKLHLLQSERGQKAVFDTADKMECLIALNDNEEEHFEDITVLEGIDLAKEPTSWITKDWKSGICIVEGDPLKLHADVFAVPFTDHPLPDEITQHLLKGNVDTKWLQNLKKDADDTGRTVKFVHHGNFTCKDVAFFQLPSLTQWGKKKDLARHAVQHFLNECVRKNATCIVIFIDFLDKTMFKNAAKQILYIAHETIKHATPPFNMKVCLMTVEENKQTLQEILKNASSTVNKFKRIVRRMRSPKQSKDQTGKEQWRCPKIDIEIGSLHNQKVDAIVCSVNKELHLWRGKVSSSLNTATNKQLQKECMTHYPHGIGVGEVAITKAMGLNCQRVFYACVPDYPSNPEHSIEIMRQIILDCLKKANDLKFQSLAFPVLGVGNLGYPSDLVANVMFNTVEVALKEKPKATLQRVLFVLYSDGKKDAESMIKMFQTEWMARCYQISSVCNEGSRGREGRVDYGDVTIQVIEGDLRQCTGLSDGIICFWTEEHISCPDQQPIVGPHLQDITWPKNAFANGRTVEITEAGKLPSRMIINVLMKKKGIKQAIYDGLKAACSNKCSTVQIPLPPRNAKRDLKSCASGLKSSLHNKSISNGTVNLVTLVTADEGCFSTLLGFLRDEESSGALLKAWTTVQNAVLGDEEEQSQSDEDKDDTFLVVTAKSEADCMKAHHCILQKLCEIQTHSSSVDYPLAEDKGSVIDEMATENKDIKVISSWKGEISAQLLRNKQKWSNLKKHLQSKFVVTVETQNMKTYLVGDLETLCKIEKDPGWIDLNVSVNGSDTAEKDIDFQTISVDHAIALNHLIGSDKMQQYYIIDNVSEFETDICLRQDQSNNEEAQKVKQRVEGVIQEVLPISEADWGKAAEAAKEAMKETNDVYIKYQDTNHKMIMFAEDWDKMDKAKKRVQIQFGQTKTARGKRRFKTDGKSKHDAEKPQTDLPFQRTYITQDGVGIAEGRLLVVKVYKTDITKMEVDAIVNAANGYLGHGGGVARAIADKAGLALKREGDMLVQKYGTINVSHLVLTTAGKLPSNHVIHAVGPCWDDYKGRSAQCLEDLCCTILRCLCTARNEHLYSIAFPSISAAIFGVPQDLCAKMYVRALKSFDETVDGGSLKQVHFVDISDTMVVEIQKEFQTMWNQSSDRDELYRDSTFINRCLGSSDAPPPTDLSTFVSKKWSKETSSKHITETPTKPTIPGIQHISENTKITVKQGEITDMHADAIVSWEDMLFKADKTLAKTLMRKGGDQYERERRQLISKCTKSNTVLVTPGGSLKQKYVLHAVIPQFVNAEVLCSSLEDVFITSLKKGCSTVLLPPYLGVTQGDAVKLFIEAVVHSLRSASSKMPNQRTEVILVDSSDMLITDLKQKLNQHLISLSLDAPHDDSHNDCPICQDKAENPKKLECGHVFCTECIDRAFEDKKVCPVCKAVCGTITGTMPPGKMDVGTYKYTRVPGYESHGAIIITYTFKDGKQMAGHPNPGQRYVGTSRTAYLPDTPEGRKVLALLRVAWDRKLTFTVGQSVTREDGVDRVTWNEIHHKTNIHGGIARHGYPDPEYLKRVQEELAQQGVTEADLGATGTSV